MSKLLITLSIPVIEMNFDVYLPINKKIGTLKKYLSNTITELTDGEFNFSFDKMKLIDKESGIEYTNDLYLKDSGIKNGSWIILI